MAPGEDPSVAAAVLRGVPDVVVVLDSDGRLQWASRSAERLFGVKASSLIGTSALEFVHPDDLGVAMLSLSSVQDKEVGTPVELRVRTEAGWRLVEVVGSNMVDDPEINGLVVCLRDITERRRWEIGRGDDKRFRSLVHNAASILLLVDVHGRIQSASAAVTRLLGHDQEAIEGRALDTLATADQRAEVTSALGRALDNPAWCSGPTTLEVDLERGDGRPAVPFELTIVNLVDDPTVEGLVVSAHDVTQLRAAREALEELATHDSLTGLPNRSSLQDHLGRHIEDSCTAVIFLDLDGFKPINDEYGHATGDELLRSLADRLRHSVRKGDIVARYGGDEFVVVAKVAGQDDIERLTARLIEAIECPVQLAVGTISVSASVGLAYPTDEDTPRSLLARADSAMYLAKHANRRRQVPLY